MYHICPEHLNTVGNFQLWGPKYVVFENKFKPVQKRAVKWILNELNKSYTKREYFAMLHKLNLLPIYNYFSMKELKFFIELWIITIIRSVLKCHTVLPDIRIIIIIFLYLWNNNNSEELKCCNWSNMWLCFTCFTFLFPLSLSLSLSVPRSLLSPLFLSMSLSSLALSFFFFPLSLSLSLFLLLLLLYLFPPLSGAI